jgi:hypothetical protein
MGLVDLGHVLMGDVLAYRRTKVFLEVNHYKRGLCFRVRHGHFEQTSCK